VFDSRFANGKGSLLASLEVELTERCNHNCIHCCINLPENDDRARQRELDANAFQEVLGEAASLGCLTVRFTGGEPLLREDWEEIYLVARKFGLRVILSTNATLITPGLAKLLSRIPPLENVDISVYGMSKESYESVTQTPGSHARMMRGIALLEEQHVPFTLTWVPLPPNVKETDAFDVWASEASNGNSTPLYLFLFDLRRNSSNKNSRILDLRWTPAQSLQFLTRKPSRYVATTQALFSDYGGLTGAALFPCGAGLHSGCVDAYGSLQACLTLRHPQAAYDLSRGSLKDALTDFFPQIRQQKAANPDYLSRCARCFLKPMCHHCPAKSWMEHGTLDTPVEYLCDVAHAQARWLGLLHNSERAWEVEDHEMRIKRFITGETHEG
jgi:radical SAM protein with 4Fe4S-binding SPASM domain